MSKTSTLPDQDATDPASLPASSSRAEIEDTVRAILVDALHVERRVVDALTLHSGLFGSLPEIDSMAVANLITAIEDGFGITIDDDDVDGEMLETFGGLVGFVERRLRDL